MRQPQDLGQLAGVVFDLDGTLVDSERVSRIAYEVTLAEDGHVLTDEAFLALVGHPWPRIAVELQRRYGYSDESVATYHLRVNAAFLEYIDQVRVFEDAAATVAGLHEAGVPLAVCTSSGRASLDRALSRPALAGRFAAGVARQDTDEHKPKPAPYLLAAARLGVDPRACVAVEDSPTGIAAARAAGMRVVAVNRGLGLDTTAADLVTTALTPAHVLAVRSG